jgi:hypothetical protein
MAAIDDKLVHIMPLADLERSVDGLKAQQSVWTKVVKASPTDKQNAEVSNSALSTHSGHF